MPLFVTVARPPPQQIFSVQRSLQGENVPQLVEPGRKLIKQGNLSELSAINRQIRTRRVFVFNDAIVTTKQSTKSSAKSSTKSSTKRCGLERGRGGGCFLKRRASGQAHHNQSYNRTTYTFKSMLDFAKCQVLLCKMDHNLAPLKTHIEIQSDRQALVCACAARIEFSEACGLIKSSHSPHHAARCCLRPRRTRR